MSDTAQRFAEIVVADAFDQGVEFVRLKHKQDPKIFEDMVAQINSDRSSENVSVEEVIAAAASSQAIAALFSNIQLTGLAEFVLLNEDGSRISLDEDLGAPPLENFFADGWLGQYAHHGMLAKMWQMP